MRKNLITFVTACMMAGVMSMTAFAGQWQAMGNSWAYQNDDGSYIKNGWNWVDGRCYYFDASGFVLQNTTTPDGLTVDENGAWVVNGVIQTQAPQSTGALESAEKISFGKLTFVVPEGFVYIGEEGGLRGLFNYSLDCAILFMSEDLLDFESYEVYMSEYQEVFLDGVANGIVGGANIPYSKSVVQLTSGAWYCYQFGDVSSMGIPGTMTVYGRIKGTDIQLIAFAGGISSLDTNAIMNNNVR